MQGANALAADRIRVHIETRAERNGGRPIQDSEKPVSVKAADRAVEKAGAHGAIRFHNGRDPGSIAAGSDGFPKAQAGPKVVGNPQKFLS